MSDVEEDDALSIISATTQNSVGTVSVFPLMQAEKERLTKDLVVETDSQISEQDGSTSPTLPSLQNEVIQVPLSTKMIENNGLDERIIKNDVDDDSSEMSEVLIPLKQKAITKPHHGETEIDGDLSPLSKRQTNQESISIEMSQSLLLSNNMVNLFGGIVTTEHCKNDQPSKDIGTSCGNFISKHIPGENVMSDHCKEQNERAINITSNCINHLNIEGEYETKPENDFNNTFDQGKKESNLELELSLMPKTSKKQSHSKQPRKYWRSESEMLRENTADFFKWNTSSRLSQSLNENELGSYKRIAIDKSQRSLRVTSTPFGRDVYKTRSSQQFINYAEKGLTESKRSLTSTSKQMEKDPNKPFCSSSQAISKGKRAALPKTDLSTGKLNLRIGKLLTSIDTASEREQEVIKTTVEHCMMKLQDNLEKNLSDSQCQPHLLDHSQLKNLLRIIQSNLTRIMMLYKKLERENRQPEQPSLIGMHVQHKKNLLAIVQRQQELVKQLKILEGEINQTNGSSSLPLNKTQNSFERRKKTPSEGSKELIMPNYLSGKRDDTGKKGIGVVNTDMDMRFESKKEILTLPKKGKDEKSIGDRKEPADKAIKRTAEDYNVLPVKKKKQESEMEVLTQNADFFFSDQDAVSDGSETLLNEDLTNHGGIETEEPVKAKGKTHSERKGKETKEPSGNKTQSEMLWLNMLQKGEDRDVKQSNKREQGYEKDKDVNVFNDENSVARTSVVDTEDLISNDVGNDYISESESVDILTATKVNEAIKIFDDCAQPTQGSLQDEELFSQTETAIDVYNVRGESLTDEGTHKLTDATALDGKGLELNNNTIEGNKCDRSISYQNQKYLNIDNERLLDESSNISHQLEGSHQEEQVSPTSTCISSVFLVKTQDLERRQKQRMMEICNGTGNGQDKSIDHIPEINEGKVKDYTSTCNVKVNADDGKSLKIKIDQIAAAQRYIEPKDITKAVNFTNPHTLMVKTQKSVDGGMKAWPDVKFKDDGKTKISMLKPQTPPKDLKTIFGGEVQKVNDKGSRPNEDLTSAKDTVSLSAGKKHPMEVQYTHNFTAWRDLPSWRDLFAEKTILPGKNVLSVKVQGSVHRASLTENGKICDSRGIMFNTPAKWMSSLTSGQTVKKSMAFQQIHYEGKPITAYCKTSCQQATHRIDSQINKVGIEEKRIKHTTNTADQVTQTEPFSDAVNEQYIAFDEHLNLRLSTSVIRLLKKEDFVSSSDLPTNFWTEDYSHVKLCKSVWDSVTMW